MLPHFYNNQNQKDRRRELRGNQTEAEKILWQKLRARQINKLKFYRQYSVGPYILDFFCPQIRLAVELDGEYHKETETYDKERENFLGDKNIATIRFWNSEVLNDSEKVLKEIRKKTENLPLDFHYHESRTERTLSCDKRGSTRSAG